MAAHAKFRRHYLLASWGALLAGDAASLVCVVVVPAFLASALAASGAGADGASGFTEGVWVFPESAGGVDASAGAGGFTDGVSVALFEGTAGASGLLLSAPGAGTMGAGAAGVSGVAGTVGTAGSGLGTRGVGGIAGAAGFAVVAGAAGSEGSGDAGLAGLAD